MERIRETAMARARQALDFARSGNALKAYEILAEALNAYPEDVDVQHISGVVNAILGESERALIHFHEALKLSPNFHFTEVEIAIVHQRLGDFDKARYWFDKAITSAPTHLPAYIKAAQLERERGRSHAALHLLECAREIAPADQNVLRELVDVLVWQSERKKATEYLEQAFSVGLLGPELAMQHITLLAELAEYEKLRNFCRTLDQHSNPQLVNFAEMQHGHARLVESFDRTSVTLAAEERQRSQRWRLVSDVRDRIKNAINTQTPLSLIRLGDGEGRILVYLDSESRQLVSQSEAYAIGDSIWCNWFGSGLHQVAATDLHELKAAIDSALTNADIIGLSSSERLSVDNRHFGYLAYLEKYVAARIATSRAVLTDATVNTQLHHLGRFYGELLTGLDFIGVIGPHQELAHRLANYFRIPQHFTHLVPGEMRLPEHSNIVRGSGHFPKRYNEIMTGLAVPRRGAVFLVAAGLLGKLYCDQIKRLGGIAIDIGAVADAWAGFNTRPGSFDNRHEWLLPTDAAAQADTI